MKKSDIIEYDKKFINKLTNTGVNRTQHNLKGIVPVEPSSFEFTHQIKKSVYNYASLFLWGGCLTGTTSASLRSNKLISQKLANLIPGAIETKAVFENKSTGVVGVSSVMQCSRNRARSFDDFYCYMRNKFKTLNVADIYHILSNLKLFRFNYSIVSGGDILCQVYIYIPSATTCSTISRINIYSRTLAFGFKITSGSELHENFSKFEGNAQYKALEDFAIEIYEKILTLKNRGEYFVMSSNTCHTIPGTVIFNEVFSGYNSLNTISFQGIALNTNHSTSRVSIGAGLNTPLSNSGESLYSGHSKHSSILSWKELNLIGRNESIKSKYKGVTKIVRQSDFLKFVKPINS